MSDEEIKVKVKMTSNATVYTVTVNKTCTVEELKKACENFNSSRISKFSFQRKNFR